MKTEEKGDGETGKKRRLGKRKAAYVWLAVCLETPKRRLVHHPQHISHNLRLSQVCLLNSGSKVGQILKFLRDYHPQAVESHLQIRALDYVLLRLRRPIALGHGRHRQSA